MHESCLIYKWVTSHTYEWVTSHTYEWVMSHTWMSHVSHVWMSHVSHIWMSHVSHIWMSHVSHIWMSHVSHIWMSHVSHIWMSHNLVSHVFRINESRLTTRSNIFGTLEPSGCRSWQPGRTLCQDMAHVLVQRQHACFVRINGTNQTKEGYRGQKPGSTKLLVRYKWVTSHIWVNHVSHMGWLRLVGSLKLQVSFTEDRLFYRSLLQKRPVILRSLLSVATPYEWITSHTFGNCDCSRIRTMNKSCHA